MGAGTEILTDLGVTKIRDAAGSGSQVKIKYVALGDGSGGAYNPTSGQTSLVRERLRAEIDRHYKMGQNSWHVTAHFPSDAIEVVVREIGFFDEDDELIVVWAGEDVGSNRRTGSVEYHIAHDLVFGGIAENVVIIDAPANEYFDHAVLKLRTDALTINNQLKLSHKIRILENAE